MRRHIAVFLARPRIEKQILEKARKDKQIIYGARSVKAQLGLLARSTEDWDIFTKKPASSANKIQEKLDREVGFDYFYSKKGVHKGTYKVKGSGYDMKKETKDDEGIADYTLMPSPQPPSIIFNNIKYRKLNEEIRRKKEILRDKKYKFRWNKDRRDLELIKSIQRAGMFKVQNFPKINLRV